MQLEVYDVRMLPALSEVCKLSTAKSSLLDIFPQRTISLTVGLPSSWKFTPRSIFHFSNDDDDDDE